MAGILKSVYNPVPTLRKKVSPWGTLTTQVSLTLNVSCWKYSLPTMISYIYAIYIYIIYIYSDYNVLLQLWNIFHYFIINKKYIFIIQ